MTSRLESDHHVQPPKTTASPVKKFLHQHPAILKTANAACAALGIAMIYDGIKTYSAVKAGAGFLLCGSAYVMKKLSPVLIPPTVEP